MLTFFGKHEWWGPCLRWIIALHKSFFLPIPMKKIDVPALLRKGVDDVIFSSFTGHNLDVDQTGQACSFQTLQGLQLTSHLQLRWEQVEADECKGLWRFFTSSRPGPVVNAPVLSLKHSFQSILYHCQNQQNLSAEKFLGGQCAIWSKPHFATGRAAIEKHFHVQIFLQTELWQRYILQRDDNDDDDDETLKLVESESVGRKLALARLTDCTTRNLFTASVH